jgi:hypothetical protein
VITALRSRPDNHKPNDLLRRKSISHTESCDFSQQSKAAAQRENTLFYSDELF